MAFMSQEKKAKLAPKIKEICKRYGIKATVGVRHHSTLVVNLASGPIDFVKNLNETCMANHHQVARGFQPVTSGHVSVNVHWYKEHYSGKALKFLEELIPACNVGNHDRSDIMTDYFDVGWYVDVNVGKWDKPYVVV